MSNPRPLTAEATPDHLHGWIIEWTARYDVSSDDVLLPIAMPSSGFDVDDLAVIYRWKLGKQWRTQAVKRLHSFALQNPGVIEASTAQALAATDDTAALASLRAISGMKTRQAVALGSAVLMVGRPTRWSVVDRMANASLVHLREVLSPQASSSDAPLHEMALTLANFKPAPDKSGGYPAVTKDWVAYMECVRAISKHTWLSLRTIDRALYASRGR